jgi:hypothetical protein
LTYQFVGICGRSHVQNHLFLELGQSVIGSLDHPHIEVWIIPELGRELLVTDLSILISIYSLHEPIDFCVGQTQSTDHLDGLSELGGGDITTFIDIELGKDRVDGLARTLDELLELVNDFSFPVGSTNVTNSLRLSLLLDTVFGSSNLLHIDDLLSTEFHIFKFLFEVLLIELALIASDSLVHELNLVLVENLPGSQK